MNELELRFEWSQKLSACPVVRMSGVRVMHLTKKITAAANTKT